MIGLVAILESTTCGEIAALCERLSEPGRPVYAHIESVNGRFVCVLKRQEVSNISLLRPQAGGIRP